jgi:hypothetical protein
MLLFKHMVTWHSCVTCLAWYYHTLQHFWCSNYQWNMIGCCTHWISNIHRGKNPKVWDQAILPTIQFVLLQPILCPGNISSKHKWVALAKCIRALHLAGAIHGAGNEEEVCEDWLHYFQEHLHKCICSKVLKKHLVPKSYCYEWHTTP